MTDTGNTTPVRRISTQRRLFSYVSLQFAGTMISRVAGFARELLTAVYFGAGSQADAFIAALTIPTLFRQVLGEDVVERSFMPGIREHLARREHAQAWRLASASLNWMLIGIAVTVALVYLAAPWFVDVVAQGIHQRTAAQSTIQDVIHMTRVLTPFILFIALAAYVGGLLFYGFDLHFQFSLAPAILSVGAIVAVIFYSGRIGVYALAWGFVAGAVLQFFVQVPFLWMRRVRESDPQYSLTLRPPRGEGRRMWRETAYVTLQSILTKTTEVVDRRVASFLVAGSISSLWFAARLIQLPNAIIGIAISRAVTPYLSEQMGLNDRKEFKKALLIGYRYNLLLILPTTGLSIALAHPIVRLVFERGRFGAHDTDMTALAFWCYSLGLLGMSLYTLGARICSALRSNRVATATAVIGGGLNIWLNYVLSATALRHGGLALATSIAFTVNSALLFGWLHHFLQKSEAGFTAAELLIPTAQVTLNAALASAAAYLVYRGVILHSAWLSSAAFVPETVAVMLPVTVGLAVYSVISLLNPVEEVRPIVRRVAKMRRMLGRNVA